MWTNYIKILFHVIDEQKSVWKTLNKFNFSHSGFVELQETMTSLLESQKNCLVYLVNDF